MSEKERHVSNYENGAKGMNNMSILDHAVAASADCRAPKVRRGESS